jgi:hypothetical protein
MTCNLAEACNWSIADSLHSLNNWTSHLTYNQTIMGKTSAEVNKKFIETYLISSQDREASKGLHVMFHLTTASHLRLVKAA